MCSKPIHSNPAKTEKNPLLEHKGQPCRNMFLQAHALSKVHDLSWIVRMILSRVHLWKPCYNFSFQKVTVTSKTSALCLIHWITGTGTGASMEILVLGTVRRASGAHSSAEQGCFRFLLPFRCPCLPLSQWEAQAFRCFRLPLPLPPTISVGGSGLPLLPPSAALASHYLSGRLRPSAASAFRCPCLPLSQWKAQAFRCFRFPLPLPPTISVRGSGAASAFRCPCLPLSQWEARAHSALEP